MIPVVLSRVCMAATRTVWFSFHLGCHRSAVSLSALSVSPLIRKLPWCGDRTPASVLLLGRGQVQANWNLFFLLLPSSYRVCVGLYILFCWSGTPVPSQLVFCMHFWVWWCIPDVFVERDVLHVSLLLCYLPSFDKEIPYATSGIREKYSISQEMYLIILLYSLHWAWSRQ